jgi:hypothetical protein
MNYLVVKDHIDDLHRAAERARMARGVARRPRIAAWRGVLGRLRGLIGRCPELTVPDASAGCP